MNGTLLQAALFSRPRQAAEAARAEDKAYVLHIYLSGPGDGPDDKGFITALGKHMTFDIMLPSGSRCDGVTFSNEVPEEYRIKVRQGQRVWVERRAGLLEFCIPWLPYVKPCAGAAARGGSGNPFKRRPLGTPVVPDAPGGGDGPTGLGGAGPSTGAGNDGGVPP